MRHIALCLALLAMLATGTASAASVLDQLNEPDGTAQGIGSEPWVQTFTAGRTGALTSVVLPLSVSTGEFGTRPESVTVTIHDTATGVVHRSNGYDYSQLVSGPVRTGPALATATIDGGDLPDFSYDPARTTVTFSSPPTVEAGRVYALGVQANGSDYGTFWAISAPTDVDGYPDGSMYVASGGEWYDYGYQPYNDSSGRVEYIDGGFETWIEEGPADADADGVIDDDDNCPGTPADAVHDAGGCSLDQLVPCAGPWKNHGQYVKAFNQAAKAFREAGLITEAQRGALTSAASQSSCGK